MDPYQSYPPGMPPQGYPQQQGYPSAQGVGTVSERTHIEEVAEAIIDEKWEEMIKNFNKISDWREKTDATVAKLEQEFKDLKENFENLHKAIIGKIGEYDQNILNVGTEIKVMEKVFQKILPVFTENVNELARITKEAKSIPQNIQRKGAGNMQQHPLHNEKK